MKDWAVKNKIFTRTKHYSWVAMQSIITDELASLHDGRFRFSGHLEHLLHQPLTLALNSEKKVGEKHENK
jgi:hypothetical protein